MKKPRILIIDDQANIRSILSKLLTKNGYQVQAADSGESGLELYAQFMPSVILLDLKMPGIDGMEVMEVLDKKLKADCKTIIMTAHGEVRSAVEAMKKGVYEYLTKPLNLDELFLTIRKAVKEKQILEENIQLRDQVKKSYRFENIIGNSKAIREIYRIIAKVAQTQSTVLIRGESGVGRGSILPY